MKNVYAAVFGISSFFAMNCGSSTGDGGGYLEPTPSNNNPPAASTASSSPAASTASAIRVNGASFDPPVLKVKKGTKVTWTWESGGHNVVSGDKCTSDGKFTSGSPQGKGTKFEHTFGEAGTFPYYCDPHCGMGMTGSVVVEEEDGAQ